MVDLLHGNSTLQAVARQLLGPDLEQPERIRGIYCVFPDTDATPRPARFHVDRSCLPSRRGRLWLTTCRPTAAASQSWPGSHRFFLPYVQDRLHLQPALATGRVPRLGRMALRFADRPCAYLRIRRRRRSLAPPFGPRSRPQTDPARSGRPSSTTSTAPTLQR